AGGVGARLLPRSGSAARAGVARPFAPPRETLVASQDDPQAVPWLGPSIRSETRPRRSDLLTERPGRSHLGSTNREGGVLREDSGWMDGRGGARRAGAGAGVGRRQGGLRRGRGAGPR